MCISWPASLLLAISFSSHVQGRNSTKLPPLGFNTWNHFACNISETLIKETADLMVSTGLRDAGYVYVNLDDCWASTSRDGQGNLVADPIKFPSGMKALGDYIHSKGLLFGIYGDRGTKTCAGYPGSYGYELQDAETYASWGVDYLKYDNCYTNVFQNSAQEQYTIMQRALESTKRDIYYSICSWGQEEPWKWGPQVGDSWRISGDIGDLWKIKTLSQRFNCPCIDSYYCPKFVVSGGHDCSVLNILHKIEKLTQYTSTLGFNDADMLEVGRSGMTFEEYRSHFAFWAALKSPLLIGADLAKLTPEAIALLSNKHLLAVNQDPLKQSIKILKKDKGSSQLWAGNLADGGSVLLALNEKDNDQEMVISFKNLGFERHVTTPKSLPNGTTTHTLVYNIQDLWTGQIFSVPYTKPLKKTVKPHDTLVFKLLPPVANSK